MHIFLAQTKRIPILLTYIFFLNCGQYIVKFALFALADDVLSLVRFEQPPVVRKSGFLLEKL